jgi:hypothetical protein
MAIEAIQLPTTYRSSMPSGTTSRRSRTPRNPSADVLGREPSARRTPSSSRRSWITVTSAGCRIRAVWRCTLAVGRNCPESTLSRAASLPRRQAPSGRSELVSEINVSQPADPQGFCDCRRSGTSAQLCWRPPTSSAMRTEHFTEREVSALLRPLRSGATWANGRPHSGSLDFADTEEVTGSNPVAPTIKALTSGNAAEFSASTRPRGEESTLRFGKRSPELGSL